MVKWGLKGAGVPTDSQALHPSLAPPSPSKIYAQLVARNIATLARVLRCGYFSTARAEFGGEPRMHDL